MKLFNDFGNKINQQWRSYNYDESVFANVAYDSLSQFVGTNQVDYRDILKWVFNEAESFDQPLITPFGEPPVTLYRNKHFYIAAYFWLEAVPTIHAHGFSGAFTHIHGQSLHTTYSFDVTDQINTYFHVGKLHHKKSELCRVGEVKKITGGERFIHSLFHLDRPTVTLIIRGVGNDVYKPYFTYYLPGTAFANMSNSFDVQDNLLDRQIKFLTTLSRVGGQNLWKYTEPLLNKDVITIYKLLECFYFEDIDQDLFHKVINHIGSTNGELVNHFIETFEQTKRRRFIISLRNQINDPDLRFFLSLLFSVDNQRKIYDLIEKEYFMQQPHELVLTWIESLSRTANIGFTWNEFTQVIFQALLENPNESSVLEQLGKIYHGDQIASGRDKIIEHINGISSSLLLKPLFSRPAPKVSIRVSSSAQN